MKTRTMGLVTALILAAGSVGVIAYLASRGPAPRTATGAAPSNVAPPDIKDLPTSGSRGGADDALIGGKGLFVQVMDKNDPTRIASEILSKSLEPLEAKNYRVDEPRAWIYLKSGRIVHVQAKQGRLHMPDRTREPDSGTLDGQVDIRLFDPPPAGQRINLDKDQPLVRGQTESLQFDGSLGEVSIPPGNLFNITSPRTDFTGHGMRLLFNQTQERIELLRVERDGVMKHRPKSAKSDKPDKPDKPAKEKPATEATKTASAAQPAPIESKPAAPSSTTAQAPATAPAAPTAPAPPPAETFYHTVITGPVNVTQGERSITHSETLQLWTHLIGNELAPGAIADNEPAPVPPTSPSLREEVGAPAPKAEPSTPIPPAVQPTPPSPQPHLSASTPSTTPPSTQPATPSSNPLSPNDGEVVVTWSGPMEVRPLEARPPELKSDEVALRFTGTPDKQVLGSDAASDSTVTADSIEYGATSRAVTLAARDNARLQRTGQGSLVSPKVGINMSTGVIDIPARGELIAARKSTDEKSDSQPLPPRSIKWADNAQFKFALRDGAISETIREALMVGSVVGTDGAASITGERLQAWFVPDDEHKPVLRRLLVKENALAKDGRDGHLRAQSLDVAFAPAESSEDPTPRSVAASGEVHGERNGAAIDCGSLDASLARDEKNKNEVIVTKVNAKDNVRFAQPDGVHAEADELRADAVKQVVDLVGERAMVGKKSTEVFGEQIRLDGLARGLEVFGPGRFDHQAFDDNGLPTGKAEARWTKGMTFDDMAGLLNASGTVIAVNEPDEFTIHTLHAERVKMKLTPFSESAEGSPVPSPSPSLRGEGDAPTTPAEAASVPPTSPSPRGEVGALRTPPTTEPAREVLLAEAFGSDLEGEGADRAKAELRRYDSAQSKAQGTTPQQVQYLEGSHIIADNQAGTLTTPSAGKMLVVDRRRPASSPSASGGTGVPPASVPPTSPSPRGEVGVPAAQAATPDVTPETSRGDALFDWQGSMTMNRAAGSCVMDKRVKMTHIALDDGSLTELECETLTAHIREEAGSTPAVDLNGATRQVNGRLVRADAAGAVYIRSKGKELLADGVRYDADARTVEAWANDGNTVNLFDPKNPAPLTARRLFWNLATDRVEIREASPIIAPR